MIIMLKHDIYHSYATQQTVLRLQLRLILSQPLLCSGAESYFSKSKMMQKTPFNTHTFI